ncbi:hypothetical protein B9Z48_18500 [Limnohabitans sp. WS1]|nr:hypothetical protein B9Z48_18500 [Limnohabitans sp. WS1]
MLALARAVMSGLKPPTYGEGASSGQRYFVGRSFSSDDAGFGACRYVGAEAADLRGGCFFGAEVFCRSELQLRRCWLWRVQVCRG